MFEIRANLIIRQAVYSSLAFMYVDILFSRASLSTSLHIHSFILPLLLQFLGLLEKYVWQLLTGFASSASPHIFSFLSDLLLFSHPNVIFHGAINVVERIALAKFVFVLMKVQLLPVRD